MTSDRISEVIGILESRCARREYCQSDIRRKATKLLTDALAASGDCADLGDVPSAVDEILSRLVEAGFVDDVRYARAFASDKSSLSGWGPAKIRFALRSKGIPSESIEQALSGTDGEKAAVRLQRLLCAKWKTLRDDPYGKFKLIRYALSRGYEYCDVEDAVNGIVRGEITDL